MNWKQKWIDAVLSEIPAGKYRGRAEAELCDHLETQCQVLMEAGRTRDEAQAETLRLMGDPEALRGEYRAVWQQSLLERLKALGFCLRTWAVGLAVTFGTHLLVCMITYKIAWKLEILLPGNYTDLQLLPALIAGAYYLRRKTRTRRHPAWQISGVLAFYWTLVAAFDIWWEALDDHIAFWEELKFCLPYKAGYYESALALCVLFGLLFGDMSAKRNRHTAS